MQFMRDRRCSGSVDFGAPCWSAHKTASVSLFFDDYRAGGGSEHLLDLLKILLQEERSRKITHLFLRVACCCGLFGRQSLKQEPAAVSGSQGVRLRDGGQFLQDGLWLAEQRAPPHLQGGAQNL